MTEIFGNFVAWRLSSANLANKRICEIDILGHVFLSELQRVLCNVVWSIAKLLTECNAIIEGETAQSKA